MAQLEVLELPSHHRTKIRFNLRKRCKLSKVQTRTVSHDGISWEHSNSRASSYFSTIVIRAKKNRKKVITPDDINSLFAEKKPIEDEDEESEEDEEDQNALTGMVKKMP